MKTKLIPAALLISVVLFSCNNKKGADKEVFKDASIKETQLATVYENSSKSNRANNKLAFTEKKEEGDQIPVGNDQSPSLDSIVKHQPLKPAAKVDWDKKIIKNATLKLEVKHSKDYNETVHKTVKQFSGYIAQEENNLTDEKSETIISIKVPVDQFEDMMNQLPGADVKVLERKITTEDVTGEMVDTRSRLEAKKQMRLKYLEFLKQSKNMEEVLQVQSEINSIQEEIEAAAGRVEFLSHQSAFSTINLTFYEPLQGFKPDSGTPSFLTRVSNAFRSGGKWCAELFVGLISIWPLVLIIIAGIVVLRRTRAGKVVGVKA